MWAKRDFFSKQNFVLRSSGDRTNFISDGFGPISGLSSSSIERVILLSTLKGSKILDGRSVLKKAKAALAECRILVAYWMDFLIDGSMPSGMTEEDALEYVLNKSFQENSIEIDDNDEDEEMLTNENDDPNQGIKDETEDNEASDKVDSFVSNKYSCAE